MFITVLLLLSVLVIGFISYQYQREKQFKIGILHTQLKDYNHQLAEAVSGAGEISDSTVSAYIGSHPLRGMRYASSLNSPSYTTVFVSFLIAFSSQPFSLPLCLYYFLSRCIYCT